MIGLSTINFADRKQLPRESDRFDRMKISVPTSAFLIPTFFVKIFDRMK
jgi:hypothetical protein